ncbi:MAG: threonylcarbamoyl-AMP synthase [Deltaproteobacteria bacterium]|jgi:tRNA threonylcarbamoyl adenosine modification protein (Sua5/YciO/YrdC/YwlC family)|nr:threonylcarbamoyl-AMP synthase [Deltaproteobacteria bacterium]
MIISINPTNPQGRLLEKVVKILQDGGVIAYPTDTQYGLGCDLSQKKSIEKIYRLKHRNHKTPFSIICADLTHISEYALVSNFAYRTLKRLLPGPFTFVLPGTRLVPQIMLTKRHEVGLRVPNHSIAIGLVRLLGRPLINTSASAGHGQPVLSQAELIEDTFKGAVDAVIDGGAVPGEPSTLVSLIDDDPSILRQGLGVF